MFYQLEGNETLSYNSNIFICIPSEPQWKMKDLYISNSSEQNFFSVNFPLREFFFVLRPPPPPPHKFSNGPFLTRVKFACVYKVEEMYEKAACKR